MVDELPPINEAQEGVVYWVRAHEIFQYTNSDTGFELQAGWTYLANEITALPPYDPKYSFGKVVSAIVGDKIYMLDPNEEGWIAQDSISANIIVCDELPPEDQAMTGGMYITRNYSGICLSFTKSENKWIHPTPLKNKI